MAQTFWRTAHEVLLGHSQGTNLGGLLHLKLVMKHARRLRSSAPDSSDESLLAKVGIGIADGSISAIADGMAIARVHAWRYSKTPPRRGLSNGV